MDVIKGLNIVCFSDYGGLPIKVLDDKKLLNIWNR